MNKKVTVGEAFKFLTTNLNVSAQGDTKRVASMLMEDLLGVKNVDGSRMLKEAEWITLKSAAKRLNNGEPLQYVSGKSHFYGLQFIVEPAVLIPRSETEELVYYVLEEIKLRKHSGKISILDIGTGSGCIALTLKLKVPQSHVTALDNSRAALLIVEKNMDQLDLRVDLVMDDITKPLTDKIGSGVWDYIVSNPPYIQNSEKQGMDRHVLLYEPVQALFPQNGDPLDMYQSILVYSKDHLRSGGRVFLELNEYLSSEIQQLANEIGFTDVQIIDDMQGKPRILKGLSN